MYKKLSYLLLSFVLLGSSLSASSLFAPSSFDPDESTRFTVTYKTFKPSRVYGVSSADPNAQSSKNRYDDGFGFGVNFMHFEYSTMYDNGERFIGYYTFANNSPVNPYIGISYIKNTKLYDSATKSKVDGADGLLGIQVSYFKFINPYFEYMPISTMWMFGVRIQLQLDVEKRDAYPANSLNKENGVTKETPPVAEGEDSSNSKAVVAN